MSSKKAYLDFQADLNKKFGNNAMQSLFEKFGQETITGLSPVKFSNAVKNSNDYDGTIAFHNSWFNNLKEEHRQFLNDFDPNTSDSFAGFGGKSSYFSNKETNSKNRRGMMFTSTMRDSILGN